MTAQRLSGNGDAARDDVRALLVALGLPDHARPYSLHDVVHRDIIPAIHALFDRKADEGDDPRYTLEFWPSLDEHPIASAHMIAWQAPKTTAQLQLHDTPGGAS